MAPPLTGVQVGGAAWGSAVAPAYCTFPSSPPRATPRRPRDGWFWALPGHQDFEFSSSQVTHLPQEE